MKLFKRIFVILIILITILIYYKFENKKINYVAINITEKENYSDYNEIVQTSLMKIGFGVRALLNSDGFNGF